MKVLLWYLLICGVFASVFVVRGLVVTARERAERKREQRELSRSLHAIKRQEVVAWMPVDQLDRMEGDFVHREVGP